MTFQADDTDSISKRSVLALACKAKQAVNSTHIVTTKRIVFIFL